MLTTKKRAAFLPLLAVAAALLAWSGCTPSGPRALLKGERLLKDGRPAEAVPELEKAVSQLNENAQAWNHLGLAYHYSGQTNKAVQAYQQALSRDRNLTPAYYNLGVLQLELNNFPAAIDALHTFTAFRSGEFEGWLKLATAQLRYSRQYPPAEKTRLLDSARTSVENALKIRSNPEALNLFGMVLVQKNRVREAIQAFNTALQQQPNYAPALLNLAVVYHQQIRDQRLALRLYRDYLTLEPPESQRVAVESAIAQLEAELAPPVQTPATNALAQALAPAVLPTNAIAPATTNLIRAETNQVRTNVLASGAVTTNAALAPTPSALVPEPPVQTVRVPELPPVKTVEDPVTPPPRSTPEPPAEPAVPSPGPLNGAPPDSQRDTTRESGGTLRRLNPANWFGGKETNRVAAAPGSSSPSGTRSPVTPLPRTRTYSRYTYRAPVVATPGNRREAERFFRQAVEAHQARRHGEAIASYRKAAAADPSFFEVFYNWGLAAFESKNYQDAIQAYERAVALKPGAPGARYNFAMALLKSNYPIDAANELQKAVEQNPEDAQAELALANVYAQQLYQISLAREQYRQVLEANPNHPEAVRIRYWLAANP